MLSIQKRPSAEAHEKCEFLQTFLEENNKDSELVAVVANLDLCAALLIPLPRLAEFNAASVVDQLRFVSIAKKALQREKAEGTFLELFEDEYLKEFV